MHCKPYESILEGNAELVGTDEYKADVYISNGTKAIDDSVIL